jgi:exodeoxyribonuclease VII small subunit
MSDKKLTFEESMARLDAIVKELEKGEASLDASLSLFEEGTSLIKYCGQMLDLAEQKVVKLRKGPDGQPQELPFEAEDL